MAGTGDRSRSVTGSMPGRTGRRLPPRFGAGPLPARPPRRDLQAGRSSAGRRAPGPEPSGGTVALCHSRAASENDPHALRVDGGCEAVKGDPEPVAGRDVGGDLVVAAAHVLHEGMTTGQDTR